MIGKARELYARHARWVPIATFVLGFLFDAYMLRRIDELKVILQQALYIIVSGLLIAVELIEETREVHVPAPLAKVWKHREALLHFLLGTLLNSYTIFYFKSASSLTSLVFILVLVALLMLNEFKRFGKSQTQVHVAYLTLCLISYLVSLAPTVLGFMGVLPFTCAVLGSIAFFAGYFWVLRPRMAARPRLLQAHLLYPFIVIETVFVALYFAHLIPPVPLSVKYMGIYHGAEKSGGEYELSYTRPAWKFWEHGDQTFEARPGDLIYCYVQVFSPTRFNDQLKIRWRYRDTSRGWVTSDLLPLPVHGGREEGYRAVTQKANYQPGEWRVGVETQDAREVGSIGFKVVPDQSVGERETGREVR